MIRFREAHYSSKFVKALTTMKRATSIASTKLDNAGLKAAESLRIGRKTARFRFQPKSKMQAGREAVKVERKVKQAIADPGAIASEGVGKAVENPIMVSGNVGSKVLMVTNPETAALPIGTIAMMAEGGVKKAIPGYAKMTEGLGRRYKRSTAPSRVRYSVNGAYRLLGGTPIV